MNFPSVTKYNITILKNADQAFSTLDKLQFVPVKTHPFKEYCFSTGTFAAIYKAVANNKEVAIRCFLNARQETFDRYKKISAYLKERQLPWAAEFDFLENEIEVEGSLFPVVKMEWVNGKPINLFIDEIIFDYRKLSLLQEKLIEVCHNMEANGIGHGDLQCGNVLIESSQQGFCVRLVDYDSMYIPSFKGETNLEAGRQEFQHPLRTPNDFSETVDRFSFWVMITALEAVKIDKNLWKQVTQGGFNTFDNLLFTGNDFVNPDRSYLFQRLRNLNHTVLNYYLEKLYNACQATSIHEIECPHLFDEQKGSISKGKEELSKKVVGIAEVPDLEVLINSKPSGKSVFHNGIKKGITPLMLKIPPNEGYDVCIIDGIQKIPIDITNEKKIYTIEIGEQTAFPFHRPALQPESIVMFKADRDVVFEGDMVTLKWQLAGNPKASITNIGEITEMTGTRTIVITKTTEFTLIAGTSSRSIVVYVHQKEPENVNFFESTQSSLHKGMVSFLERIDHKRLLLFGLVLMATVLSLIGVKLTAKSDKNIPKATSSASVTTDFTKEKVVGFLKDLYDFYNKRYMYSILNHYANHLDQYNDLVSVSKTQLQQQIDSLYIKAKYFHCTPAFYTLSMISNKDYCTVTLVLYEQLKKGDTGKTKSYTTKVQYTLNKDYKIVSEKIVSAK